VRRQLKLSRDFGKGGSYQLDAVRGKRVNIVAGGEERLSRRIGRI
jgi:hypothetical protein